MEQKVIYLKSSDVKVKNVFSKMNVRLSVTTIEEDLIKSCQTSQQISSNVSTPTSSAIPHLVNGSGTSDDLPNSDNITVNKPVASNGSADSIANSTQLTCVNGHSADISNKSKDKDVPSALENSSAPPRESWLLRLFESRLFQMNFAINYLAKSKEPGVISYIGNRMFTFDNKEVDFYLPQLVALYINHSDIADAVHPYFVDRCRSCAEFSLQLAWLLNAFCNDKSTTSAAIPKPHMLKKKSHGLKLKNIILNEELRPKSSPTHLQSKNSCNATLLNGLTLDTNGPAKTSTLFLPDNRLSSSHIFTAQLNIDTTFLPPPQLPSSNHLRPPPQLNVCSQFAKPLTLSGRPSISSKKSHHRSYSDATGSLHTISGTVPLHLNPSRLIGDLTTGQAFDNGCVCFDSRANVCNELRGEEIRCQCGAPRLLAEYEFVNCLMKICTRIQKTNSKDVKTQRLMAELSLLNLNLPARVWLPIYSFQHMIVRIPPGAAVLLNSKDKAPYLLYMEAVEFTGNINTAPLPNKVINTLRPTRSEENLVNFYARRNVSSSNNSFTLFPQVDNFSDCWTHDDDDGLTMQYSLQFKTSCKESDKDSISQLSQDSSNSAANDDRSNSVFVAAGEIRRRLSESVSAPKKTFTLDPDDPSAAVLKEPWDEKEARIRESSPYGHLQGWRLVAAIVKCGDDLRQEVMVHQVMVNLKNIWEEENVPLWLRPYKILATSADGGIIEPILNSISLHQVKKHSKMSLYEYFLKEYGPPTSESFLIAQRNFVQSCAAYCIVSYLMQVKDR